MKRLHFDYEMKLEFDSPIHDHRFSVRCMPQTTERQLIEDVSLTVFPEDSLGESRDSFGNICVYGYTQLVCTDISPFTRSPDPASPPTQVSLPFPTP